MKSMASDLYMIGDKIVVNVNQESRSWGFKAPADGATGTIVKFREIAYARVGNYCKKPGIYENRCYCEVRMDTGETVSLGSHHYEFPDDDEVERRYAAIRTNPDDPRFAKKFIRELPETKLWEGDVVRVRSRGRVYDTEYGKPIVVRRIDYNCINSTRDDGSPYPFYDVSNDLRGGWSMSFEEGELELIERGRVWKHFHGEPISFSGIEEESSFFMLLGHYDEIKNPATKNYAWSAEQVIAAIRAGDVDAFDVSTSFLGVVLSEPIHHAIRFDDREFGKRVGAEVIKNFEGANMQQMESDLRDKMQAARAR